MQGRIIGISYRDIWGDYNELSELIDDAYNNPSLPDALNLIDDEIEESTNSVCRRANNKLPKQDPAYQQKNQINNFAIYFNLGVDRRNSGDMEGAIDAWNQVLRINSKNDHALYNRGVTRAEIGDYIQAIEDFDQVIRINPKYYNAYYQREKAYQKIESDYSKAFQITSEEANAYYQLGEFRVQIGRYREAIEAFSKALWLNPQLAEAYYSRGKCLHKLKDKQGAIEDFRDAAHFLCINKQDKELARWTPYELGESLRKEAIIYLFQYFRSNRPSEKKLAASAIYELAEYFPKECNSAIPYLLANLLARESQVRNHSLKALISLNVLRSAFTKIKAIAENDSKSYNRKIAEDILKKMIFT